MSTRTLTPLALLLALALALAPAGCGDDDTTPALDGGATTGDAATITVAVVYNGASTPVALAQVTPVTVAGTPHARLSDLVKLALPQKGLAALEADLEAGDGFRPGKSPNCTGLTPLAGDKLDRGYVHLQSRNLRWDDALALPGCMGLRDLARVLLSDK